MSIAAAPPRRLPTLVALVAGTDHKRIGLVTATAALGFFVAGGVMALLMRAELAQPELHLLSRSSYNALFTMHGSVMIYLFVTPIALALGVYVVPLQVGAAQIARPRLALAGLWLYLAGGLTMLAGFLTSEGPGRAGWTAFDPLSDTPNTPGTGMDFWIFGVMLAAAGTTLLGGCVLGTILRRRAPGMPMLRMPVFTWSMPVTALMVVASFPVLMLAMTLLYIQRQVGGVFEGADGAIAGHGRRARGAGGRTDRGRGLRRRRGRAPYQADAHRRRPRAGLGADRRASCERTP
jgi:cytochrome c oxidase subunit 1